MALSLFKRASSVNAERDKDDAKRPIIEAAPPPVHKHTLFAKEKASLQVLEVAAKPTKSSLLFKRKATVVATTIEDDSKTAVATTATTKRTKHVRFFIPEECSSPQVPAAAAAVEPPSSFTQASLSAAMAARANAALGCTTVAGDNVHRTARLLVEAGNALAPGVLLPRTDADAGDDGTRLLQPLDLREFLSPLSTFGYSFIKELLERTQDDALRTIQVNTAAQLAQCTLSPRAHDDLMLRSPRKGEPVCGRGDRCEATKLRFRNATTPAGKPAMAYWPPHLWEQWQINPASPACNNVHNRLCLLCLRLMVTEINTLMMAAGTSQRYHDVALVYIYNAVDVPGEYRRIDTIGAGRFFNGIAGNIVAHDRCAFELEQSKTGDGVLYYRQLYPKPGDASSLTTTASGISTASSSLTALLRRAEQEGFSVASSDVLMPTCRPLVT